MYAADVDGRRLTLAVSGMLWQRSLVMVDVETGSLWSHLLGEAMRGEMQGKQLESLPSVITDWKTWRDQHPQTTVLNMSRTSENYRREFYRDPSRFVVGLSGGGRARAWPFDQLRNEPLVNDQFDKKPVLAAFDAESGAAWVYDRRVKGKTLTFRQQGESIVDDQTGSTWNRGSGKATAGPLAGEQLKPLAGIASYRQAWSNFHPDSEYWEGNKLLE